MKYNETGKTYDKWFVESSAGIKYETQMFWNCKCVCGTKREVSGTSLRTGRSRSCGCTDYRKKTNSDAPFKRKYTTTRHGALRRNFIFELTLEEYIELSTQDCYWCGDIPNTKVYAYSRRRYTQGKNKDVYVTMASIDRKDSSKGYTIKNCVPSCLMCNRMKSDFKSKDFLKKIEKIYLHQKGNRK
jgi:hypothetical protein